MISIDEIKKPITNEFLLFDKQFNKMFESNNDVLSAVNKYILQKNGKQIRPILTILAAKICGISNMNTIYSAISLELLHNASLIHDDIVDDTFERRGRETINAIWKNKISVLVGDYLLSQALSSAGLTNNLDILHIITNLGKELAEGELLQISNSKNINTNEEKYIEVITKKTAKLFEACTSTGAISSETNSKNVELLAKFGKIYGICFQIKDDIFDYISNEKEIGKPVGNDIKEGKITLPLIYALNISNEIDKKNVVTILENKDFAKDNIDKKIRFAIDNGGIKYSEKRMLEYKNEAMKLLDSFEDSDVKNSLILTLEHTIERKNWYSIKIITL